MTCRREAIQYGCHHLLSKRPIDGSVWVVWAIEVNKDICSGFYVRQRMIKDCTSLCQALNARYSTAAGRSICRGVIATVDILSGVCFFQI